MGFVWVVAVSFAAFTMTPSAWADLGTTVQIVRYASVFDAIDALDRTVPGTNSGTQPSYLFGQPNSAWNDDESFLLVLENEAGMDILWLEASDLDVEVVADPANGYYEDTDGDGEFDGLSNQYYYDLAVDVLPNVNTYEIRIGWLDATSDGLSMQTSAVFFEFGPGKWCIAIRYDVLMEVVPDDPDLEFFTFSTTTIHPVRFVSDYGAAVSWAELISANGNFGPDRMYAVPNLKKRLPSPPSNDAPATVDPTGDPPGDPSGDDPDTPDPNENPCMAAFRYDKEAARFTFKGDAAGCRSTRAGHGNDTLTTVGGCCVIGAGILAPFSIGIGSPAGCIVAAITCGIISSGEYDAEEAQCLIQASQNYKAALATAKSKLVMCCADSDNPNCAPDDIS